MNSRQSHHYGSTLAVLFSFVLLLCSAGCTKYADMDDLEKLDEAKQAAISAEAELNQAQAERRRMLREIEAKRQELEDAKREQEIVKQRLSGSP